MPRVHLPDGRIVNFPDGMDPQQIHAEVTKLAQPTGDTYTGPDTYWGGFLKSALDTAKQTGKGVLEGLNPVETVKNFLGGAKDLATNPETQHLLMHGVTHPGDVLDAAGGAAQSLSDPETGGKAIGGLLQGLVIPKVPAIARAGVDAGVSATNAAGRGVSGLGRFAQSAGDAASTLAEDFPPAKWAGAKTGGKIASTLGKAVEGLGDSMEDVGTPEVQNRYKIVGSKGRTGSLSGNVDRYMPNTSDTPTAGVDTATPLPEQSPDYVIDRYMPNTSSTSASGELPRSIVKGDLMPNDGRMDELLQGYARMDQRHIAAGLDPVPTDLDQAVSAITDEPEVPSTGPNLAPGIRNISDRVDKFFGPGAVDNAGSPAMADAVKGEEGYSGSGGANHLYDPQTPTDYIRQQLLETDDPTHQDFLRRSITQRSMRNARMQGK